MIYLRRCFYIGVLGIFFVKVGGIWKWSCSGWLCFDEKSFVIYWIVKYIWVVFYCYIDNKGGSLFNIVILYFYV